MDAGRQARQDKAFAKAGKEFYEAWKLKPSEVSAAFEAASAYVSGEDYPLTVTVLRELSNSKEQKAADEAKRFLDRLRPATDKKAAAYYQTGSELLTKGDSNGAIENLNQAILLNPNHVQAFNDRGLAYSNKKEFDRAIGDFDQAIQLNANFAMAFHNRGKAYLSKGLTDQGMKDMDQAMKLGPSQEDVVAELNRGAESNIKEEQKNNDVTGPDDLGVTLEVLTPQLAESTGITKTIGVVVSAVQPGSFADEAGIRPGDVLMEIDRRPIRTQYQYKNEIAKISKGRRILFLVRRGNSSIFLAATPR